MMKLRRKSINRVNGILLVCTLGLGVGVGQAWAGVKEGRKVFEEENCIMCHSLGDQKGEAAQFGGSLDHVGDKLNAAWLKAYLHDPKSKMPEAKMPKEDLSDKQIDDLVAYLLSLK